MRIHVLSDLLLEFAPFEAPATEADVVVLAGDIQPGTRGLAWAREAFPAVPVVDVAGSHEYCGPSIPRHRRRLRDLAHGSNVHLLENKGVTIAGARIVCNPRGCPEDGPETGFDPAPGTSGPFHEGGRLSAGAKRRGLPATFV